MLTNCDCFSRQRAGQRLSVLRPAAMAFLILRDPMPVICSEIVTGVAENGFFSNLGPSNDAKGPRLMRASEVRHSEVRHGVHI